MSRCSVVASGNKRVRMVVAGGAMKAVSSSGRWGLWDPVEAMVSKHEGCHAWVYDRDKITTETSQIFQNGVSPK